MKCCAVVNTITEIMTADVAADVAARIATVIVTAMQNKADAMKVCDRMTDRRITCFAVA